MIYSILKFHYTRDIIIYFIDIIYIYIFFFNKYALVYTILTKYCFTGVNGIPGVIGPQGMPGIPGLDGCNGTDVRINLKLYL